MKKFRIERPFDVLKGIRDKELTNLRQLLTVARNSRPTTFLYAKSLEALNIITLNQNNGDIEPTESANFLFEVFGSLDLRLRKLKDFGWNSMIVNPIFPDLDDRYLSQENDVEIFVLMPFSNELLPIYEDHIKEISKELGYKCLRADDFFTTDSIMNDIWIAINQAKVLIADCTGRNPNVFYEIGLAHTLGKQVILISQNIDDIPFDLRHRRAIIYDYTPRGMKEFDSTLKKTIQYTVNEYQGIRRVHGYELIDGELIPFRDDYSMSSGGRFAAGG